MAEPSPRRTYRVEVKADARAIDLLAESTGLSRGELKRAMISGACWLERPGQSRRRLRRATTELKAGDRLALFHDPRLLAAPHLAAALIQDLRDYSVWYKPAGMVTQGSEWGDALALLRQVEQQLAPRPALPVHRIDREAAGVVVVAHSRRAAGALSALFAGGGVEKRYRIQVRGDLRASAGEAGTIDEPLDGRPARSHFTLLGLDEAAGVSTLEVRIETGRYHQIRRHFDQIHHPVMGDPRYGRGNKNSEGMRLVAVELSFTCPLSGRPRSFRLPEAQIGF